MGKKEKNIWKNTGKNMAKPKSQAINRQDL